MIVTSVSSAPEWIIRGREDPSNMSKNVAHATTHWDNSNTGPITNVVHYIPSYSCNEEIGGHNKVENLDEN